MQLYFIRHGQSTNNANWDLTHDSIGRSEDPELTEAGRQQAAVLGEFLSRNGRSLAPIGRDPKNITGFHLTHLYCSLMRRAVQTGSAIAEQTGLPLTAWVDIHEEGGIYLEDDTTGKRMGLPGSNRAFFQQYYPHLVLPDWLTDQGWWNRDFEVFEDRLPRARRFLADLLERHGSSDDRVAVVSHGGFFNLFMNILLERDPDRGYWFSMSNAAITRIDFDLEQTVLVYTNRTDFLPDELIT